jgi:hypothetical protein
MRFFSKPDSDITLNLERKFEKAADEATKESNTSTDMGQYWWEFEVACEDAKKTSVNAAYAELKEHYFQRMQAGGMSKVEAENLFELKWKSVMDLGVKVRTATPRPDIVAKYIWLKIIAGMATIAVIIIYLKMCMATPTGFR